MNEATKEILVEIKSVYGNEAIYPVCAQAKLFAEIANTKTLTTKTINTIKDLGFKVKVQQQVATL
jgi:hypothetical protein